jgi:hypothetical protein
MRTLAPSEKNLLFILGGAVFIALNMMGLHTFLQTKSGVQKAMIAVKSELSSDRNLVELGRALKPADSWITAHPMPRMAPDDASAQLLKLERDEAEKAGLKIAEENILPSQETPYGPTVAVSVKLTGPFEGVVRMLFALQSPTAWRTLEKLALKSDTQPPNVVVDLEIHQYFLPPTSAEPTPQAPTP